MAVFLSQATDKLNYHESVLLSVTMSEVLKELVKAIDAPNNRNYALEAYCSCWVLANLAKDFENLRIAVSIIFETKNFHTFL